MLTVDEWQQAFKLPDFPQSPNVAFLGCIREMLVTWPVVTEQFQPTYLNLSQVTNAIYGPER